MHVIAFFACCPVPLIIASIKPMTHTPGSQETLLDDGKAITIETGKLARQAQGSVVVRCGDTMLLATVVSNHDAAKAWTSSP